MAYQTRAERIVELKSELEKLEGFTFAESHAEFLEAVCQPTTSTRKRIRELRGGESCGKDFARAITR